VLLGNGDGTFQDEVEFEVEVDPRGVAIGDLDGDEYLDLAVANLVDSTVSVLLGNGDGTFQDNDNYSAGVFPNHIAIGDLDHDGSLDMAVADSFYAREQVMVFINTTKTIASVLACEPASGSLPFNAHFDVALTNQYTGFARVIDGNISVALAGGQFFPHWKCGRVTLSAGDSFVIGFNQVMPGLAAVVGENSFTLMAEDVTPAPFNQPPYAPSGDTDTTSCTVTGIAP
jgi:hypothetical protein